MSENSGNSMLPLRLQSNILNNVATCSSRGPYMNCAKSRFAHEI
ncbi:MAG: hypothetical protein P4M11_03695 [Candidatus Pacebacteria bacterium]|nr:hypothetical protein [Candidatus Paceibacterota bacterium]